ncbi:MAG TPA: HAMP domain-containing protein [Polyangiaceae bacterium]|nr:HAMP domain-containing protein [Polyangiaceae bacterium]
MVFAAIRNSISLKVSLTLAAVTLALTSISAGVIISHQTAAMEDMTLSKAKLSAQLGAQGYGQLLEQAVDDGHVTVQDVFDTNYEEIKGYDWGGKPKYHTRYDFITDRIAVGFLDRFLESDDFVAAIAGDVNGYVPTHNSKFMKPLTGDPVKDLEGNRTKRIFNDDIAMRAAKSVDPVLIQPYRRDTGAMLWYVSSPVFVKGKHWGAFRVLVSMDEIARKRGSLIGTLTGMFAVFAVASAGVIFLMIRRSMQPLTALTQIADQLSIGEGLETPIKPATTDEVGTMAKSLDRLRASLKAAMARLGE